MDTNINDVQGRYTSETIRYDDANLATIIAELESAKTLISTTIPANIKTMENSESLWEGKSKEQYLGLKELINKYQADFATSVSELKSAVDGLETLLASISESNVIKEIDSA